MRICYIANSTRIHVQRWVQYFADRGHDIHVISISNHSDEKFPPLNSCLSRNNIKIYYIKRSYQGLRFLFSPAAFFYDAIKVKTLLKRINPDIIHAHYVADQGIVAAFSNFRPFVLSAWGSDILVSPRNSRVSRLLVKYALKKSDIITCDGENLKERMKDLGVDELKIRLIYHGVDPEISNFWDKSMNLRQELDDQLIVISCRHFFPLYNVESLIKAVPLILKEFSRVKFLLASDGPEKQKLENLAKSLGVSNKIIFLGFLPSEQLHKYLASSDIYVSTSITEGGVAVSTMEAMASNLPLILTNVGDNNKWVENEINGFIVPINDVEALADKIVYLLKNDDIRIKFGKMNRELVNKKGNYFREMEKMENIYQNTIRGYKK